MSAIVKKSELEKLKRYKPYPAYKDSGVEWLGEVPEHWEIKRLKEYVQIINGYPFDSNKFSKFDGIPLVRIRDLGDDYTSIYYDGYEVAETSIDNSDILIGMDGNFDVVRWHGGRALLNQRVCCLRTFPEINSQYVFYTIPYPLKVLNELTYSTTVKHLSSFDIYKFKFGLPTTIEQNSIAKFLDRETARIDALIAKQERLIELLQEKRAALITRAVTKGLDPDVPMKDSGVEWLGEIPAHWDIVSLKRRFDVRLGKMLQNEPNSPNDELAPYIRAANITWNGVDISDLKEMWFSPREKQIYSLQKGDLLVSEGGDVGRSALWGGEINNCYIQNAVNRVRSLSNDKTTFLYFWMFMLKHIGCIDMLCSKATIGHFTAEKVESVTIASPPPEEQQSIIDFLEKETKKIEELTRKIVDATGLLKEYRTALISAAVTGKIDVCGEVS